MSEELHGKILPFLAGEFARKEGRQCVKVELLYAPTGGFRAEELRTWNRSDEPDLFNIEGGGFAHCEELVRSIIEIAEGHADSFGGGNHRFVIRTFQHLGGRATHSFRVAPSFSADDDGGAIAVAGTQGGGGRGGDRGEALNTLTQNNLALMRSNQAMFDGTIRVLGATNKELREENAALREERSELRRALEEAQSTKLEREFQMAMATEKHQMKAQSFQKLLQLGTIVAAKFTGGMAPDGSVGGAPPTAALAMMLAEFGKSLREDQISALMTLLDVPQKALFMEIMSIVSQSAEAPPQGAPHASPPSAGPPVNGARH